MPEIIESLSILIPQFTFLQKILQLSAKLTLKVKIVDHKNLYIGHHSLYPRSMN